MPIRHETDLMSTYWPEASSPFAMKPPSSRRSVASPPIRIYLVLGYRLLAEAISASFKNNRTVSLIGSTSDTEELLATLEATPVDVLLIDSSLGHDQSLEIVRVLSEKSPNLKILPLGLEGRDEIVEFIEAGTSGYVAREASFEELLGTIESVHRGEAPCSPQIAASVFARVVELAQRRKQRRQRRLPQGVRLTAREKEVLEWVSAGLQNKEIAERLGITLPTVKNHVHKILEKFQVKRRQDAIQLAKDNQMLGGSPPWKTRS